MLTNKYAEGYPGPSLLRRDASRSMRSSAWQSPARSELFGADHANVQPHAGSQANEELCIALLLDIGDTILAMNLDHGGHLTHGSPVNFLGASCTTSFPTVFDEDDERIDYDEVASSLRKSTTGRN